MMLERTPTPVQTATVVTSPTSDKPNDSWHNGVVMPTKPNAVLNGVHKLKLLTANPLATQLAKTTAVTTNSTESTPMDETPMSPIPMAPPLPPPNAIQNYADLHQNGFCSLLATPSPPVWNTNSHPLSFAVFRNELNNLLDHSLSVTGEEDEEDDKPSCAADQTADRQTTDRQQTPDRQTSDSAVFNINDDNDDDNRTSATTPQKNSSEKSPTSSIPSTPFEVPEVLYANDDSALLLTDRQKLIAEYNRQNSQSDVNLAQLAAEDTSLKVTLNKKCVSFADDRGLNLLNIKEFHEKPDEPPFEDSNLMRSLAVLTGQKCSARLPTSTWLIDFAQPISDYVKFYQTLERNGVCLENALIRNDVHKLLGTVRVRNYCFEKLVRVKYSTDSWKTETTLECEHKSGNEFFDIFQFEVVLPMTGGDVEKVQFCICFVTPAMGEKWDSNGGDNYSVISQESLDKRKEEQQRAATDGYWNKNERLNARKHRRVRDALRLNIDNWADFSSWNNLTTDEPYY